MQYSDFIENGDANPDEIIAEHLREEEKLTKKNNSGSNEKGKDNGSDKTDEDEIYEDDPEFERMAQDESEEDSPDKKAKNNDGEEEDDDDYDYMDDSLNLNVKSPKATLIEHLRLLSDIFNSSIDGASDYYDQIFDERAQFLLDFENILKIMTFDETVEYVLPVMQIYSSEQDYLKLKLFQNFEKLFKKMFKAAVFIPQPEIIDIITINIFPLASRMLMLSDEPVQLEGVDQMLNLCKTYIPKEQSKSLMLKVI